MDSQVGSVKNNLQIPGHIRRAFRSIQKFLPVIDIMIELVDARMPEGSRLKGLCEKTKKKTIIVLGKADLADERVTNLWLEYYKKLGIPVVSFCAKNSESVKELKSVLTNLPTKSSGGERKTKRAMVIGVPNVGKSTLINSLVGRKAAKVANLPGVTRNIQWIKLATDLELLDLPGILDFSLLKKGSLLRLINVLPSPDEDPEAQAELLYKTILECGYNELLNFRGINATNSQDFLTKYAKEMQFLKKGSDPDLRRAANDFIKRFQDGHLGRISFEKPNIL